MAYTKVTDDGLVVYGASGLGACSQALLYDRMGVDGEPPPDWLQKAYNEGNNNEQRIIDLLEAQGVFKVIDNESLATIGFSFGEYEESRGVDYSNQVRVEAKLLPGVVARAHLDGIANMMLVPKGWNRPQDQQNKLFIIEAKALGDSYWQAWKSKGIDGLPAGYKLQVSCQMKGAGLPCIFVVGHKDKQGVVFEIDYCFFDEPPVKWLDIIKKISEIEKRIKNPELDGPDCEMPLMYPCPYYQLHDPDKTKGGAGIVVLNDDNTDQQERVLLLSLAEEYERHGAAEKHHKELKDKAKEAVAKWFDDRKMKGQTVEVGPYVLEDYVGKRDGALDPTKIAADLQLPNADKAMDKYRKPKYEVRWPKLTKKNKGDSNGS